MELFRLKSLELLNKTSAHRQIREMRTSRCQEADGEVFERLLLQLITSSKIKQDRSWSS